MKNRYLTKKLKEYYIKDFHDNVLTETSISWKLDAPIRDYLIKINKNNNIQTLYSKFYGNDHSLNHDQSYLEFAYTKKVEIRLLREFFPRIVSMFNQLPAVDNHYSGSTCYFSFNEPKIDRTLSDEPIYKMGFHTNRYYKNINRYWLSLESSNKDLHNEFWKTITADLASI